MFHSGQGTIWLEYGFGTAEHEEKAEYIRRLLPMFRNVGNGRKLTLPG